MAELLDGAVELLELDGFLDHRDGSDLENFTQNLTVGIPGDDHDGKVRVILTFHQPLIDLRLVSQVKG